MSDSNPTPKVVAGGITVAGVGLAIPAIAMVVIAALVFGLAAMLRTAGVSGAFLGESNANDQSCIADGVGQPVPLSQQEYVNVIVGAAKAKGVSERGQIIAVMVGLQESGLLNYANNGENVRGYNGFPAPGAATWLGIAALSMKYPHDAVGNDADSVGLFQQRPSAGWGDSPDEGFKALDNPDEAVRRLLDPAWAAAAFFGGPGGPANRGLTDIPGWELLTLSAAAQKVQGSAFPQAYAKWEAQATQMVRAAASAPTAPLPGAGDIITPVDTPVAGSGKVVYPLPPGSYRLTSSMGPRWGEYHAGQDFAAPLGTPIYAVADGEVIYAGEGKSGRSSMLIVIRHMIDGVETETWYVHMYPDGVLVKPGQMVTAGETIALVGSNGRSTGPHLHLEVHQGNLADTMASLVDPIAFLQGEHAVGAVTPSTPGVGCTVSGTTVPADGSGSGIVTAAQSQHGVDYSWGGGSLTGPSEGFGMGAGIVGFDCSGLTRYAIYQATGGTVEIPRNSAAQYKAYQEQAVDKSDQTQWQPGDLIFYSEGGADGIYHVAIYAGNGQMVEAPRTGDVVKTTAVRTENLFGVVRVPLTNPGA